MKCAKHRTTDFKEETISHQAGVPPLDMQFREQVQVQDKTTRDSSKGRTSEVSSGEASWLASRGTFPHELSPHANMLHRSFTEMKETGQLLIDRYGVSLTETLMRWLY